MMIKKLEVEQLYYIYYFAAFNSLYFDPSNTFANEIYNLTHKLRKTNIFKN